MVLQEDQDSNLRAVSNQSFTKSEQLGGRDPQAEEIDAQRETDMIAQNIFECHSDKQPVPSGQPPKPNVVPMTRSMGMTGLGGAGYQDAGPSKRREAKHAESEVVRHEGAEFHGGAARRQVLKEG